MLALFLALLRLMIYFVTHVAPCTKAVVANPSMALLLRQDMIQKMRLEYELWCPLCEEFAVPGANGAASETSQDGAASPLADSSEAPPQIAMWYEPLKAFPPALTTEHVRICQESRASMQSKTLNFVPNTRALHEILFVKNPAGGKGSATMNPKAVAILNQLSGGMGKMFQDVFAADVEQRVHRQREMIRAQLESLVQQSDAFPAGTKVVIFGSSANGFGTPQSDLDMCLQLPFGSTLGEDEKDPSGSQAMAKLAEKMDQQSLLASSSPSGIVLTEVDTSRLTARIPIIKFMCPIVTDNGTEDVIECDLSMHNPLAVLNTTFLRAYADINPVTRVMAFIIKRWAKARDINNPARHTLSSYGYIIMLLHYLTFHHRAGNGLIAPVAGPEGRPLRQQGSSQGKPLLPNLLWMDSAWPQEPPGTPYRELASRPQVMMHHPFEKVKVNGYFHRPRNPTELATLVRLFPGQDLSLAILLTSFFRYYAYEFDYKRFVVSLHSTATRGLVEREVKAELDGWRHYSAALTIEDPFETFYDVAHVLRGGYYHRIRREFAVAYSKIADVVSGNSNSAWTDANGDKVDPCTMTGADLIDWICEPVVPAPVAATSAAGTESATGIIASETEAD
jgi:DNA polymerase sigma